MASLYRIVCNRFEDDDNFAEKWVIARATTDKYGATVWLVEGVKEAGGAFDTREEAAQWLFKERGAVAEEL